MSDSQIINHSWDDAIDDILNSTSNTVSDIDVVGAPIQPISPTRPEITIPKPAIAIPNPVRIPSVRTEPHAHHDDDILSLLSNSEDGLIKSTPKSGHQPPSLFTSNIAGTPSLFSDAHSTVPSPTPKKSLFSTQDELQGSKLSFMQHSNQESTKSNIKYARTAQLIADSDTEINIEIPDFLSNTNPASSQQRRRRLLSLARNLGKTSDADQTPTNKSISDPLSFLNTGKPADESNVPIVKEPIKDPLAGLLKPKSNSLDRKNEIAIVSKPNTHLEQEEQIKTLEMQIKQLTNERDTFQTEAQNARRQLKETEHVLESTKSELAETKLSLDQLTTTQGMVKELIQLRNEISSATQALNEKQTDADTRYQTQKAELDTMEKSVWQREQLVNQKETQIDNQQKKMDVELTQLQQVREQAMKIMDVANSKESETRDWVMRQLDEMKHEKQSILKYRTKVETELNTQRVDLQKMRDELDKNRSIYLRAYDEHKHIVAQDHKTLQALRDHLNTQLTDHERTKHVNEKAIESAMHQIQKHADLLNRRAEQIVQDEAKLIVSSHKLHADLTKLKSEQLILTDRERELDLITKEARDRCTRADLKLNLALNHRLKDQFTWSPLIDPDVTTQLKGLKLERARLNRDYDQFRIDKQTLESHIDAHLKHTLANAWTDLEPAPKSTNLQCHHPSPVSPGQSLVVPCDDNCLDLDGQAWDLEDCKPKVQYISCRYKPSESDKKEAAVLISGHSGIGD